MCAWLPQHPWLFIFSSRGHLRSAFERIFNVMQLILVKIKWHIKWKYLIPKYLARTINMHTDLQISSCWEHISTWNITNSLVKVPPYSKLNFQEKKFFIQNWCNSCLFHVVWTNFFCAIILMLYRDIYIYIFSSTEHCAWAIISPKKFKSCVTRISLHLHYCTGTQNCCQIFCNITLSKILVCIQFLKF
jgi:hypothetical protein